MELHAEHCGDRRDELTDVSTLGEIDEPYAAAETRALELDETELPSEARLADPRRTEHGDQSGSAGDQVGERGEHRLATEEDVDLGTKIAGADQRPLSTS